ncbi:MAG TPA: glycosyltransferase family 2 protein [Thermodesulfobacteriota bacterium]|nr:glycosyltransferase family 2 protein [Thermodesulfobacteriota bacterium]
MKSVSLVVLNWNGEKVISRCLKDIFKALENSPGGGEVLVVDNGSTDQSISLIERDFPQARLIKLGKNIGFSEGNNIGVLESKGDIVVLVNNDAYLHPDFLVYILPHFEDAQVFSVNPKMYKLDGTTLASGKTEFLFHRGIFKPKISRNNHSSPVPCLFASGGGGAFDRKKYLELGGLLDFLYWEDLELGYRAWKLKGWKTIYEPRSLAYHDHGTSFKKVFSKRALKEMLSKNRFLFQWYALSDPLFVIQHLCSLPFNLIYYSLRGDVDYPIGFIQALFKWRRFKREVDRSVPNVKAKLRDQDILEIVRDEKKESA